jgi:hypothetical protein
MINKDIRNALFKELHKAIEESSESVAKLNASDLYYPSGVELTPGEKKPYHHSHYLLTQSLVSVN